MTYLLLLHLGPVHELIAQARRTRDLWLGSFLLSELSKAAARALIEAGAELIFPALDAGDARLLPEDQPVDSKGRPVANVANRILARVPAEPDAAARRARDAAQAELQRRWNQVHTKCQKLIEPGAAEVAQEQIDTLLDVHAAWAPCHDAADYARARQEAEAALASRKTLVPFGPWITQRRNAHKSSLDGARETILRASGDARLRAGILRDPRWRGLRIGVREELDAVGLLKRASGDPGQFVPIPTIGFAAWIKAAAEHCSRQLGVLRSACERDAFTRVRRADLSWIEPFPFDAQILLPYRWWPYLKEQWSQDAASRMHERELRDRAKRFGEQHVGPLLRVLADPHPFVACLVADGDGMGKTIDALAGRGSNHHRRFSEGLSRFAGKARQVVEQVHRGVLVYAGGDDVLAFVGLPDALQCAAALRQAFLDCLTVALAPFGDLADVPRPTLSVGFGVGHVLESLGHLLDLGREAEQIAKGDDLPDAAARRDALAIVVEKRGGQRLTLRSRWSADPAGQIRRDEERLLGCALTPGDQALVDFRRLPLGKVHELAALLRRLPASAPEPAWRNLLGAEARRILARAEPGSAAPSGARGLTLEDVDLDLRAAAYGDARHALHHWIQRVQIAAFLAEAQPRLRSSPATLTREIR